MRLHLLTASALSLAILAGCSSQPKALYQIPPEQSENYKGDFEGLTKFTLAKSQLVIDYPDAEKKKPPQMLSIPAEAVAADKEPTRFFLRQADPWGVTTHLKVTKRDNTDLLASIGTEVEDKRKEYIEGAGGLLIGLIGVMAITTDGDVPAVLPISIDTHELLRSAGVQREAKPVEGKVTRTGSKEVVNFTVKFGAIPSDAINVKVFADHAAQTPQETIFYSACRTATVTIHNGQLGEKQFAATIADPRYVQTIKLPEKGSVDMHSACGANTTSLASSADSTFDVLNALIAQTKTVREAWETAKTEADDTKKAKQDFAIEKSENRAKGTNPAPAPQ